MATTVIAFAKFAMETSVDMEAAVVGAEEVTMGIVNGAAGAASIMGWLLTARSFVGKLGACKS